jgi:hypothetical protein
MSVNQEQCQSTQNLRTNTEHRPELLSKWATENNMEINAFKTVYQFFSMHHKNYSFDLKINQNLPKSESTKYLGIHVDNKLSWKNHVSKQ